MRRNVETLFYFEPPTTELEFRDASLQFVRKLSGFRVPFKTNEVAFERGVGIHPRAVGGKPYDLHRKIMQKISVTPVENAQVATNCVALPRRQSLGDKDRNCYLVDKRRIDFHRLIKCHCLADR